MGHHPLEIKRIMKPKNKLFQALAAAIAMVASALSLSAELPDFMDEYDLVNRKNLKDIFAKAKVGKKFV